MIAHLLFMRVYANKSGNMTDTLPCYDLKQRSAAYKNTSFLRKHMCNQRDELSKQITVKEEVRLGKGKRGGRGVTRLQAM